MQNCLFIKYLYLDRKKNIPVNYEVVPACHVLMTDQTKTGLKASINYVSVEQQLFEPKMLNNTGTV